MCMRERASVCVRERETERRREGERGREGEKERERERVCVWQWRRCWARATPIPFTEG